MEMAIGAASEKPSQVEMTMPSTSPMAQPVRQWRVAASAVRERSMPGLYPCGVYRSERVEHDLLGALPQRELPEVTQVLVAGGHGEDVVAGELAGHAGEAAVPVREQDLGLAHAAGVDQDLARRRVARGVLGPDAEIEVAERDPGRLAAPPHVDHTVPEGEAPAERLDRLRRAVPLPAGLEGERPGG